MRPPERATPHRAVACLAAALITAGCSAPESGGPGGTTGAATPTAATPTAGADTSGGTPDPPAGLAWTHRAPAPTARTEVTAASTTSGVVVAGGFDAEGVPTAAVEIHDPVTDTWRDGPELPLAVHHAMAAAAGGTAYVVGGYAARSLSAPSDRAFALRPDGDVTELPPMPEPRAAAGAAVIGDRLYVAGGVATRGLADRMLVFDLDRRRWSTAPGPPTPREHLGVAAADGRLYVLGGRTGGIGSNLAAAEVYDPAADSWQRLADMPTARGGVGAAATATGHIVVPGGEQPAGTFPQVEAWDLDGERWVALPDLPTPRHGLGVAAVDTTVHVVAGGPEPGLTVSTAHEALDLTPRRDEAAG